MSDLKKISKVIKRTLTAGFKKLNITGVDVREDEDSSGDIMLLVDVIFRGAPKDVDAGELSSAVRLVRPELNKMGVVAFPLFSFISENDAEVRTREPA